MGAQLRVADLQGMASGRFALAQSQSVSQCMGPSWARHFVVRCEHGVPLWGLASPHYLWIRTILSLAEAAHGKSTYDAAG